VRETAAELKTLQDLIDRSHKRVCPHMGAITHPFKYALTATQVVQLLDGFSTGGKFGAAAWSAQAEARTAGATTARTCGSMPIVSTRTRGPRRSSRA